MESLEDGGLKCGVYTVFLVSTLRFESTRCQGHSLTFDSGLSKCDNFKHLKSCRASFGSSLIQVFTVFSTLSIPRLESFVSHASFLNCLFFSFQLSLTPEGMV